MQTRARNYLMSDRLHHIDMLETIDRGMAKILYAEPDGVLLYNIPGYTYMMSTESPSAFEKMCNFSENPLFINPHQREFVTQLQERFHFFGHMDCLQYAYLSKEPCPENPPEGISFRQLTQADTDFVFEHYENAASRQYVEDRISAGMLGALQGEALAGFIGAHAEGSVGLLEILPPFRRRGIASFLQAAMINFHLSQGKIPYGQVETSNNASIQLQQSMNLTFSDKPVIWLYAEK